MEGSGALIFSWDPLARAWLRERGPADASPPPAEPIDDRAVQTYYLNAENGHWEPTILGLRARQIAGTLGNAYRIPMTPGLAYTPPKQVTLASRVEDPDAERGAKQRGVLRFVAALLVLVTAIGGGAMAANAVLGPKTDTAASSAPTTVAGTAAVASAAPAASAAPTATATATEAPAATGAPQTTQAPARTQAPVRTAAPTVAPPPPVTTVTYSTRLANGTTITFTGPNAVAQGTGFDATFRAVDAKGFPAHDNLVMYFGQLGSAQSVAIQGDANGVYTTSIRVNSPKGDQMLSVRFGNTGELRTLGTISVR